MYVYLSSSTVKLIEENENEKLLSELQKKVYDLFMDDIELKVSEIYKKTKITMSTVKQIVAKLTELKMIEKIGQGRATRYKLNK